MLELEVGKEYLVIHSLKGTYKCKILYVGKKAVFAKITALIHITTIEKKFKIEVGQEVRITKRLATFNKVSETETK